MNVDARVTKLKEEIEKLKIENEYLIALGLQRDVQLEKECDKYRKLEYRVREYLQILADNRKVLEVDIARHDRSIRYLGALIESGISNLSIERCEAT